MKELATGKLLVLTMDAAGLMLWINQTKMNRTVVSGSAVDQMDRSVLATPTPHRSEKHAADYPHLYA